MRRNTIKEPFKYTDDHLQFIKENVEGKYTKELTELFNQHFGTNLSEGQIRGFKKRFKLKSGIDCTFKKGMPSPNKGKKMTPEQYAKSQATMFKKNNIPVSTLPIGTECEWKKNGYIYVKVKDDLHVRRVDNWKPKQQVIYEQHYGKIPDDHFVMFADGNIRNFDINNLVMVNRKELLEMNRRKLIFKDKELTKVGVAIAKLNVATYDRKKKNEIDE